jgi:succinyl-diaminopimelate desuccinylase
MSIVEKICEHVENRSGEILNLLRDLVRIPTCTPPGQNYDEIVDFMLPEIREAGFKAERIDLPEDIFEERCRSVYPTMEGVRSNLFARKEVGKKPGILWYAHIDTVPVDETKWDVPPFEGIVQEDRIWGRGAADDKSGCAAVISAFQVLDELGMEPKRDVTIALTSDEEIGPYTGLMYLTDKEYFRDCSLFHCLDGSSEGVGIGANGSMTWSIGIKGRSVHSSTSYLGINPIEQSMVLLEELMRLKEKVQSRKSKTPISPKITEETGFETIIPVLNITMAKAGVKHNIVPPEYIIEGDRRFIPEEQYEDAVRELKETIEKAKKRNANLECELKTSLVYEPFFQNPEDPWVQRIKKVAEEVSGEKKGIYGLSGSTDVAYTVNRIGLRVGMYAVGRQPEGNVHGDNENARIKDLLDLVKVICILALEEG